MVNVKLSKSTVTKVYEWCRKKYGRSKYNGRYPNIKYRKSDYLCEDAWGYYDEIDNVIFVNKDKHTNIEDLVNTIIHEYTHYKQNIKVDFRVLAKYFDPGTDAHPLEIEAELVADRDTPQCLKELFGVIPDEDSTKIDDIY